MIDRAHVARWLGEYVAAWKSYDRDQIIALFANTAEYRYKPADDPITGSHAIADDWLADRDEPGSFDAAYEPYAVDGDHAVAVGSSTYTNPDGSIRTIYDNCFLLRFDDDGRCSAFTEYFIERPPGD